MADLTTKYLGLTLKNPLIVGSSELTSTVDNLKGLQDAGAAAVVLKSLFEEEIVLEMKAQMQRMTSSGFIYPETMDMYEHLEGDESSTDKYLKLIEKAKKSVDIPIIASINCVTAQEWTYFPKNIEQVGADALELNIFVLPTDLHRTAAENEKVYFDIINEVKSKVNIPISLKISYYFSNLASMLMRFGESGVNGLVFFNRFYSPDFDIENMKVIPSSIFSTPEDVTISLRWIALMRSRIACDLAASTGVHTGTALIKQLLAGANAVQIVSTIYRHGRQQINLMLNELNEWLDIKEYKSVDEIRGLMAQNNNTNPAAYERMQFIEHFTRYKHY